MGVLGKHIENKQISVDDIIRLSNVLEEYKEGWLQKAKDEEEYIGGIPSDKRVYDNLTSEVSYDISFEDGRNLKDKDFNWFYNNLEEIDTIKSIDMSYKLSYNDYKNGKDKYDSIYNSMNLDIHFNLRYTEDSYYPLIKIDVYSSNLDQEANIIHKQLNNLKNEYDGNIKLTKNDVIKFAQILESYKKEWLENAEEENNYVQSLPSKKRQYDDLKFKIDYYIMWYDGKEKNESNQEWFLENIKDYKNIERIEFRIDLHYYDNRGEDYVYNKLDSWIDFSLKDDNYDSKARYEVDSTNMEQEADVLHSKINEVFKNNDVRYDKTIKNRFLRIQAFSIAVGIVLSYVIYIILKIVLKGSDMPFVNLLNDKNFIVFGQWLIAIAVGNIFGAWIINLIYKPFLPDKEYVGYNRKSGKGQYKEKIEDYIADSELQFGKFSDLKQKRILIEKIYRYSSIVILVQAIISVVLYLVLK